MAIRRKGISLLMSLATFVYGFSGLTLVSVPAASAASVYLVNEDFEAGTVPSDYIITPNPATANNFADVRIDPKNAANKALFLNDANSTASTDITSIEKSFTAQTSGQVTIEFDFLSSLGVNSGAKIIRLLSSEGVVAANIETKSGSIFTYRRQPAVYYDLPAYVKDTWYKFKVVVDIDSQKADVYIDGDKKLSQVPFDNSVTNIAKFDSVSPGSSSRSHYLDNIKVYKNEAAASVPDKPASLLAAPKSQSVDLSWGAVSGATFYTVKVGTASGNYTSSYKTPDATMTSYTYEGLTNGTPYYFTVSASNAVGEGANAAEATATPLAAPGKPTITSLEAGPAQAKVKWSSVSGASSYTVKSSTTAGGPYAVVASSLTGNEYLYTGLTNGNTYYIVVSANINGVEGNNSNEMSVTPMSNTPLQAPKNLRVPAMAYDEKSIILAWEKPDEYSNIVDYKVYMNGQPTAIGTANSNAAVYSPAKPFIDKFYEEDTDNRHVKISIHNYTVTGLTPNTPYTFTVKAVDSNGIESPASNQVTQSTTAVPQVFNIVDYGAVGDGVTLNTKAIQDAIDAVTPGGKVLVPAGKFKTGSIWLKSDMTLEVAKNATLLGSEKPEDYAFDYMLYDYTTVPRFYSLINAHTYDYGSLRNIRIVGEGTIDGNGWVAPTRTDDNFFPVQAGSSNTNYNTYGILAKNQTNYARDTLGMDQTSAYSTRSNLITLRGVENAFYGGFTALNPSNHTLVNLNSNHVTVTGVKLLTFDDNNADGIEFGGGDGLTVFNNIFDTGDDAMNFAAGQGAQGQKDEPTRNAWIFNNYMREGHGGVVMGSHTAAWIENILAEDNVMKQTEIGLRAKTNTPTGGGGRNVVFRDTAMKNGKNQAFIFTSAYSDVNSAIEYEPAAVPSQFKDITVKNVSVDGYKKEAINVAGVDGGFHEGIHFENVKFYNAVQTNIGYMRNSSFKDVVFVGLAAPWKIANSSGLTFTGTTTMDSSSNNAALAPVWPNNSALTASNITDTSVKLDWSAAVATDNVKVEGYRIYEGSTLIGSNSASGSGQAAATFTVNGLSPALSYSFKVEAIDASGNWSSGPSVTVTTTGVKDSIAPTAPTGSNVIQLVDKANTTWLNIKWTAATDNVGVKQYNLYANGVKKGTVPGTSTSFNATGLNFDTAYTFEVEAVDAAGNSTKYPAQLKVTTAAAYDTGAPKWPAGSQVTASEVTATSVKLSWQEATDDLGVKGYRVYQNGKAIAGAAVFTPVNLANTVPNSMTSYTVTGLTPNTLYTFKVEAGDGNAKWTGTGPVMSLTTLVSNEVNTSLTSVPSVVSGQPFSMTYGLSNVAALTTGAIYAQEIKLEYDSNLLEFVSAESVKSVESVFQVIDIRRDVPGQVRIFAISKGAAGAIATDGPLIAMNWKAKALSQPKTAIISADVQLANSRGVITHLQPTTINIMLELAGSNAKLLEAAIDNAQNAYNLAVEGTADGQYPQGAKAALKTAIDAANAVLADHTSTEQKLDQAIVNLNQALQLFRSKVIVGAGPNVKPLEAAIDNAQNAYNSAVEGTADGQYPQGAKAALKTAIDAANAVLADHASTEQKLDQAIVNLNQALQLFRSKVIGPIHGDVNGDHQLDRKDLEDMAKVYGLTSGSVNWDAFKHMDFNHDGVINIIDLVYVANLISL
ncbi:MULTISPECIES: fibronectin type III domain-containing protein [unclassified Paenibacillus]|uniref:fibronectin type III domain-containing protein n=1 Tax=unclassified Paenibacillus TaxID=185978 RepID=UPI00362AE27E